ncbi:hypothetical protein M422DRAFT_55233 [Sphaerobolus stellatus SS14]|uniref:CCR4-NOT transcription complex subunit 11 n=1 Tax=Sphaerobolus stellatus (strain SS14) TaxID=990650 RepID=A0A0C9UD30_SPHS4|nr:hypothetical protein M422DRAFT_55233 [Sphaerobolus stellatus SS14]
MPDIQGLCALLEKHAPEPCAHVARTFRPAVQTEDARTTLVKNGLVPLLGADASPAHLRILAAYLVQALYDLPNHLNPFRQHLIRIFELERNTWITESSANDVVTPGKAQFIYCLHRILTGLANALSEHTAKDLASMPLPQSSLPPHLLLPATATSAPTPSPESTSTSTSTPNDPHYLSPLFTSPSTPSSQVHPESSSPHSRTSTSVSFLTPSEGSFPLSQVLVAYADEERAREDVLRRAQGQGEFAGRLTSPLAQQGKVLRPHTNMPTQAHSGMEDLTRTAFMPNVNPNFSLNASGNRTQASPDYVYNNNVNNNNVNNSNANNMGGVTSSGSSPGVGFGGGGGIPARRDPNRGDNRQSQSPARAYYPAQGGATQGGGGPGAQQSVSARSSPVRSAFGLSSNENWNNNANPNQVQAQAQNTRLTLSLSLHSPQLMHYRQAALAGRIDGGGRAQSPLIPSRHMHSTSAPANQLGFSIQAQSQGHSQSQSLSYGLQAQGHNQLQGQMGQMHRQHEGQGYGQGMAQASHSPSTSISSVTSRSSGLGLGLGGMNGGGGFGSGLGLGLDGNDLHAQHPHLNAQSQAQSQQQSQAPFRHLTPHQQSYELGIGTGRNPPFHSPLAHTHTLSHSQSIPTLRPRDMGGAASPPLGANVSFAFGGSGSAIGSLNAGASGGGGSGGGGPGVIGSGRPRVSRGGTSPAHSAGHIHGPGHVGNGSATGMGRDTARDEKDEVLFKVFPGGVVNGQQYPQQQAQQRQPNSSSCAPSSASLSPTSSRLQDIVALTNGLAIGGAGISDAGEESGEAELGMGSETTMPMSGVDTDATPKQEWVGEKSPHPVPSRNPESSSSPGTQGASERQSAGAENGVKPTATEKAMSLVSGAAPSNEHAAFAHAIQLFIDARNRVLSLSERRVLQPHLPALTQPLCILQPCDVPALVMKNPDVARSVLSVLLDREDSAPQQGSPAGGSKGEGNAKQDFLNALKTLPPLRQSFDVIGGLIAPLPARTPTQPQTASPTQQGQQSPQGQGATPEERVSALIRADVLGEFLLNCIQWIERAEEQEREGEVYDDRVGVAVGMRGLVGEVCWFFGVA